MTATLTLDEKGQLVLPQSFLQLLGLKGGGAVVAETVGDRVELRADVSDPALTSRSKSGRLVLAKTGIPFDAAAAVRADRDTLANRAAGR